MEAREEAERLRSELEAERSKGFWRRLFGGEMRETPPRQPRRARIGERNHGAAGASTTAPYTGRVQASAWS
jgi:hypothetical protein